MRALAPLGLRLPLTRRLGGRCVVGFARVVEALGVSRLGIREAHYVASRGKGARHSCASLLKPTQLSRFASSKTSCAQAAALYRPARLEDTSGSRALLLRVPPGNPLSQTIDGHVVELGAVTLVQRNFRLVVFGFTPRTLVGGLYFVTDLKADFS